MLVEATKKMIKNWKDFKGITNRPDFWWAYLGDFLIMLVASLVYGLFYGLAIGFEDSIILWILAVLMGLPYLALAIFLMVAMLAAEIRRLRDAGFPWWAFFVCFVPTVGSIALIVFLALPTRDTPIIAGTNVQPAPAAAPVENSAPVAAPTPIVDVAPAEAPVVTPMASGDWYCPNCGAANSGAFCGSCGTAKPE